jgi:hypothetical protein
METFDACVFVFTGLTTGMAIGLAIRNKKTSNLQNDLDYLEDTYSNLVDKYTDCIIENHKIQVEKYLNPTRPAALKKKVGRPKGSTTKAKQDGKPTTRKYTRKTSK